MSKASRSQSFPRAQKPVGQRHEGFFARLKRRLRIGSKGSYSIGESLGSINAPTSEQYSSSPDVNQSKNRKESISDGEMGHNIACDFDKTKSSESINNFRVEPSKKKHKGKSLKSNGLVGLGKSNANPKQDCEKLPSCSDASNAGSFGEIVDNNFILHEEKAIDLDDDVFTVAKPKALHGGVHTTTLAGPLEIQEEPGYETLDNIRKQIDEIDRKSKSGISVECDTENNSSKLKEQTSKTSLDSGLGSPESQSPNLDADLSSSEEGNCHGGKLETRMVSSFHTVHPTTGGVDVEIINGTDDDIYANAQIPIRKKSVKKSQSAPNNVGSDEQQTLQDCDSDDYEKVLDLENPNFDLDSSPCHLHKQKVDNDQDNEVTDEQTILNGMKSLQLDFNAAQSTSNSGSVHNAQEVCVPPPLPMRKYSRSEVEDIMPEVDPASTGDSSEKCIVSRSVSAPKQTNSPVNINNNKGPGVLLNDQDITCSVNAAISTSDSTKDSFTLTENSSTLAQNSVVNTVTITQKQLERDTKCTGSDSVLTNHSTSEQPCNQTDNDLSGCAHNSGSLPTDTTVCKSRISSRVRDKTQVEVCQGSVKLLKDYKEVKQLSTNSSSIEPCLKAGHCQNDSMENSYHLIRKNVPEIDKGSVSTASGSGHVDSVQLNMNENSYKESMKGKLPNESGSVKSSAQEGNTCTHSETCETNITYPDCGLSRLDHDASSHHSSMNPISNVESVFVAPVNCNDTVGSLVDSVRSEDLALGSVRPEDIAQDSARSEDIAQDSAWSEDLALGSVRSKDLPQDSAPSEDLTRDSLLSEDRSADPDSLYQDDEPIHMSLSEVFRSKDPSVSPMIAAKLEKTKKARGQIDSEAVRAFQESMKQLKECGWYWGPLSISEAEKKLGNKPDGAFLVRDSANENYILSLTFKSFGSIHHTRIEHFKGKFGFWSQPESHGKTTIKAFIEQAMENSRNGQFKYFLRAQGPGLAPVALYLLYPVSRFKTMRSLMHMCRFQILQIVRRDHVDSLPLPQRIRNYLKEHQYYAEIIDDEANDIVGFDLNANQEVTQL